jgi:ubiquinone/menaquinone biosynthesis C-methylase UbiE
MARVDFDQLATTYDAARTLPPDALEAWREALAAWLPPPSGLPLLDLGAGTGRFAAILTGWFGMRVVAVEPSAGMREQARRAGRTADLAMVGGEAGRLPLGDGCCGAAWLSAVVHHLADLPGAAAELRRVLAPGGRVLIRGAFPGRHQHVTLFRFFPGARRIAETFPTVEATVAAFASAGFAVEALRSIPQVSAPDLGTLLARARLRTDSTLRPLPDEEFAEGLRAMEAAAARPDGRAPVVDRLDLLVLG